MLRALTEDTNGVAKLSDSAKGELESRFKRIIAEERGERGQTPGSSFSSLARSVLGPDDAVERSDLRLAGNVDRLGA